MGKSESRSSDKILWLILSAILLVVLTYAANRFSQYAIKSWGDFGKALEYPLWAAILGLLANIICTAAGVKERLSGAFRTELFLKTGLVLLGAGVNMTQILSVGARGVVQAIIMVTCVFLFTWWLAGRFKLPDTLRAVMCTAISICGVSAAIAAAGSVLAKKEEIAYITTLVILTALPLMILMPAIAGWMGMSPNWAGAWFGGNIDTTAAVVGAGAIYGEEAMKVASIVKMSQNALIGVAAFLLAVYWVTVVERKSGERPSARVIWDRFPKFVLGFILASILASIGVFSSAQVKTITNLRNWAFALAFVGIGWELSFKQLKEVGGGPLLVYIVATIFNTLLALLVAYVLFVLV